MNESVLITGVAGSGGSYLAEHLIQNYPQLEVHGIARWHSSSLAASRNKIQDRLKIHECDLCDFSSVLNVLKITKPSRIFHLASHANVRASFATPLSVIENNVMGTANLFEAIRMADINPVVQICSTSEVYGQVKSADVPIKETAPINPASPYAVSKVTQDLLAYTYFCSYGMKVIRTRMFTYINPRRTDLFTTSFALQIARIERGLQSELTHGNLESSRTFLDVRDAMEAYVVASEKCAPGEVYNIGGTTTKTVGEFLEILKSKSKVPIKSRQDPALLRPSDVTLQIPDVSKFVTATGWKPKISFDDSVEHLLEACRKSVNAAEIQC
jgi:GDP-4-dehydro-6-deoxy-D-mannose reductase